MYDRSGGKFRWAPQQTLDEIAEYVDPLLNILVFVSPYLAPLVFVGSLLLGALWIRMEKARGPHFEPEQERAIRSVPLGVGLWGLIVMHLLFIVIPRVPQAMASHAYVRDTMEIVTMGFAFFTMFGIMHIILRCGFDRKLRKKMNILDIAIIGQLMGVLGLGLFVWVTVRYASLWTGAVAWQFFVDSWMFRQGSNPPVLSMPALAKLYIFLGPIAAATLLQSRVIAISMIPKPKLWVESALFTDVEREAGKAVARIYGISAEDKPKAEAAQTQAAGATPEAKQG